MMYLGNKPIGINDSMEIDWDAVAMGTKPAIKEDIVLSDFITTIANNSFSSLPIKTVKGNNVTTVGVAAFKNCIELTSLELNNVITYSADSLRDCSKLTDISFFNTESIGSSALRGNKVPYVVAPKLKSVGSDAFYGNSSIKCTDLGNKSITSGFTGTQYCFEQNSKCIVILRYGYVLPAASNWFYTNCWLKNTTTPGVLYVWQDLIEDYQNHEVWGPLLSSNNNQILPIEGSIYETQYGDGTPIT